MPYCMVPGCNNCSKKTKGSEISFHRLPNDKNLRRKWLSRVRRENLPKANSCYVCSAHFTPDCFQNSLKELFNMKAKKTLKPGSLPSIFPFIKRKQERELSSNRAQTREKNARQQEVWSLLEQSNEPRESSNIEHMEDTTDVDVTNFRSVETQCDQKIFVDAEIQCDMISKRSIAIQTLAPRKRKRKGKRSKIHKGPPLKSKNVNKGSQLKCKKIMAQNEVMEEKEEESFKTINNDATSSDSCGSSGSDEDYLCPETCTDDESDSSDIEGTLNNEKKIYCV
ncbi:THAP domain-containing protein 1-like [Xenia sp. Carnegie-2017]|uniref:THAP domain-containing protein 1-like n=1 Tax=Xenia sp. Carnegie-2017 TaxID=2897299 RepID=UPI001F0493E1|nr:THAP domain-containing protein 1-like [Xenia sp. Carnegie-2017]